ncbi:MAG: hypothetical protein AAFP67_15770 [Pseudomonadota bacterium]
MIYGLPGTPECALSPAVMRSPFAAVKREPLEAPIILCELERITAEVIGILLLAVIAVVADRKLRRPAVPPEREGSSLPGLTRQSTALNSRPFMDPPVKPEDDRAGLFSSGSSD